MLVQCFRLVEVVFILYMKCSDYVQVTDLNQSFQTAGDIPVSCRQSLDLSTGISTRPEAAMVPLKMCHQVMAQFHSE